MVLKTCKDQICVQPWKSLHPDGKIQNLAQALNSKFDHFYRDLPKMEFYSCPLAYLPEEETQQPMAQYLDGDGIGQAVLFKQEPGFDNGGH